MIGRAELSALGDHEEFLVLYDNVGAGSHKSGWVFMGKVED